MDPSRQSDTWTDATLFADDLSIGDRFPLGSHAVSAVEITDFATHWDPQYFHVDEEAAARSPFGGLIASGIHTMAVFQCLSVAGFWGRCATIAAKGMRDVRFFRPVHPGTTLVGSLVVDEVRPRDEHRSLVSVSGSLGDASSGGAVLAVTVDAYLARRTRLL